MVVQPLLEDVNAGLHVTTFHSRVPALNRERLVLLVAFHYILLLMPIFPREWVGQLLPAVRVVPGGLLVEHLEFPRLGI